MSKVDELLKKAEEKKEKIQKFKKVSKEVKEEEDKLEDKVEEPEKKEEKKEEKKVVKKIEKIESKNDLSISCKILEKKVDEKQRTVIAGVLQEDTLSANGRFYPAHIVRGIVEGLAGKRSLIGHDTNNVEDVVAKIGEAKIDHGIVFAPFKFGTDDKSESIFRKISDGLIDSTSIRASGTTRRAKMGEEFVDVVESLDISSVDWVVEGGVAAAKVAQVFESAPNLTYEKKETKIKKEDKEMDEKLKEQNTKLEEDAKKLKEKNKELETKLKESGKEKTEAETKLEEAKLETYKEQKLATIKDEDTRALVKEQLTGKTEKEVDEQFKAQVEYMQKLNKKAGVEEGDIVIKPSDSNEKKDYKTINDVLESDKETNEDKTKVLSGVLG